MLETFKMELLFKELNPPETFDRLFCLLFLYWDDDEWLLA